MIEEGSDGEAAICCVEEREDEVEGEGGEEGEEEGVGWEEEVDEGVEGEKKWGGEPGRRGAEEEGEEGGTADCTGQGGKGNNDGKEEGGRGKREMVSSDRPTKLLPPLLSFHAQSRYEKILTSHNEVPHQILQQPFLLRSLGSLRRTDLLPSYRDSDCVQREEKRDRWKERMDGLGEHEEVGGEGFEGRVAEEGGGGRRHGERERRKEAALVRRRGRSGGRRAR